jgi:tetratricopeptide (TPR) repeat protein
MMAAAGKDAGARFCSGCGERLAPNARFCAACGQAVGAAAAPAMSLRDQVPGLVVLVLFLAAGLAVWIGVLQPGASSSRAPTRSGGHVTDGGAADAGGEMPSDHPPVGLPDEAKKFIAQLTEKTTATPKDVAAWKNLAQVQARAAEMDPSYGNQALESWNHVMELAPDDSDAIRGIGNVFYDQQKYAAAAEQYEKYLAKNGEDASVRTDLATAYLYQRQIDKAVEGYQKAIAAKPDFVQAHFNLGLAYEAKGDREKAMASLEKARSLATDDETRSRIERVKTQLAATPVGAAAAGITGAGNAPAAGGSDADETPPHGPAVAGGGAPAPSGSDYPSQVEAQLRAHQILGPKIRSIEWPSPDRTRVLVADFPMQSMPEFARNIFKARLETIIHDGKEKFAVKESRTIEIVDAASGTTMQTVTQ